MDTEIMLECARKAYPKKKWELRKHGKSTVPVDHNDTVFTMESSVHVLALHFSLEKEGWQFHWNDTLACFVAEKQMELKPDLLIFGDTKPDLLIAIVRRGG